MDRRRHALGAKGLDGVRVAGLARALGVASLEQHLYELPLAARKRISWLWPLAGVHPWIMLDEPTIGQDQETRANLSRLLNQMCLAGYGVIFVTHDDEFADMLPHRRLVIKDGSVSSP
jgi:energy-coupling factor transport system ATP-binding protein